MNKTFGQIHVGDYFIFEKGNYIPLGRFKKIKKTKERFNCIWIKDLSGTEPFIKKGTKGELLNMDEIFYEERYIIKI